MSAAAPAMGPFAPKIAVMSSFLSGASARFLTHVVATPLTPGLAGNDAALAAVCAASPAGSPSHLIAAVSAPNNVIKLYVHASATDTIQFVRDLTGHRATITDLSWSLPLPGAVSVSSPAAASAPAGGAAGAGNGLCMSMNAILVSTSDDGSAVCWNAVAGAPVIIVHLPNNKSIFSAALQGTVLVVGGESTVTVFDARAPEQPVTKTHEMHTDDVTQVRFHPTRAGYVLTGSEDTFITCFDLTLGGDMDDMYDNTLPTEKIISKMGFFGPNAEYLFSIAPNAALSLWNIEACETVATFAEPRDVVNAVICQTAGFNPEEFYAEHGDTFASAEDEGAATEDSFEPVPVHASMLPSGSEAEAIALNSMLSSAAAADADAATLLPPGAAPVCHEHKAGTAHGLETVTFSGSVALLLPSTPAAAAAAAAAKAAVEAGAAPVLVGADSKVIHASAYRMAAVVGCYYDHASDELRLAMSSDAGALCVSTISPSGIHPLWVIPPSSAHKALIRDIAWMPASASAPLFSVGNDSRLALCLDKQKVDSADAERLAATLASTAAAASSAAGPAGAGAGARRVGGSGYGSGYGAGGQRGHGNGGYRGGHGAGAGAGRARAEPYSMHARAPAASGGSSGSGGKHVRF